MNKHGGRRGGLLITDITTAPTTNVFIAAQRQVVAVRACESRVCEVPTVGVGPIPIQSAISHLVMYRSSTTMKRNITSNPHLPY